MALGSFSVGAESLDLALALAGPVLTAKVAPMTKATISTSGRKRRVELFKAGSSWV
ncbi:unannotated protein [freshwater metagenome]|uniref:Unannotated protein n=1 Tax=freshwater metagenome TaxID=449393 RepID=A0A6J7HNU7_9ZZZZ